MWPKLKSFFTDESAFSAVWARIPWARVITFAVGLLTQHGWIPTGVEGGGDYAGPIAQVLALAWPSKAPAKEEVKQIVQDEAPAAVGLAPAVPPADPAANPAAVAADLLDRLTPEQVAALKARMFGGKAPVG